MLEVFNFISFGGVGIPRMPLKASDQTELAMLTSDQKGREDRISTGTCLGLSHHSDVDLSAGP